MKTNILAATIAGLMTIGPVAPALAQSGQTGSHNPVVKDSKPHAISAPAKGANSFTEDQAKGRLAKAGYTGVSKLMKDKSGAWVGTASKAGKSVHVALDYKGNVTAH